MVLFRVPLFVMNSEVNEANEPFFFDYKSNWFETPEYVNLVLNQHTALQ